MTSGGSPCAAELSLQATQWTRLDTRRRLSTASETDRYEFDWRGHSMEAIYNREDKKTWQIHRHLWHNINITISSLSVFKCLKLNFHILQITPLKSGSHLVYQLIPQVLDESRALCKLWPKSWMHIVDKHLDFPWKQTLKPLLNSSNCGHKLPL